MNLKSKKIQVILLAIASLIISRVAFTLVNDPEGPNLLIVVVLAAIIFFVSLGVYVLFKKLNK